MHKLDPCYIADVEGEVNVDFEIDVPDFVEEVPGPTGPCFDLGGGGVSIRAHSHHTKAKKIKEPAKEIEENFRFLFFSLAVNVPYQKARYIKAVFTSSFSVDCSIGAHVDT